MIHNKFNIGRKNFGYETYELEIKEIGNRGILKPSFTGYADVQYLIEFFGLNNSDVEWYKIYGVKNSNKELIINTQLKVNDYDL